MTIYSNIKKLIYNVDLLIFGLGETECSNFWVPNENSMFLFFHKSCNEMCVISV